MSLSRPNGERKRRAVRVRHCDEVEQSEWREREKEREGEKW
jgi:hypothetical protein